MTTPTAEPSVSAPAADPAGPPPTEAHRRRRRRRIAIAAGLVAVVAVVAALYAGGLPPFGRSGSPSPPFAPTFQGAASAGQGSANRASGGPWQPALGVAVRLPYSITLPTTNLTGYVTAIDGTTGCTTTLQPALAGEIQVDGTPASAKVGASAFWMVLYVNGTGGAVGVMVDGGAAQPLFTLGGNTTCQSYLRFLVPFPTGAPDSPAVVAAANAAGGASFLSAHPNATQVFLGASIVLLLPTWEVSYSTCAPTIASNVTGSEFNATLSGTTVQTHSTGTVSCSLPTNLTLPGGLRPAAALGPAEGPAGIPAVGKAI